MRVGVEKQMREITRRNSSGWAVAARERVDHPVLEDPYGRLGSRRVPDHPTSSLR
jgi:hypothetical protein